MHWFRRLPFSYKILLPPFIGVVLLISLVLFSASLLNQQQRLFQQLSDDEVRVAAQLDTLLRQLSRLHSSIHTLLATAATERDEEKIYEQGKPLLDALHRLSEDTKGLPGLATFGGGDGALPLEPMIMTLHEYRTAAITAVEMSTVDWALSRDHMLQADGHFALAINEFQALMAAQRARLHDELHRGQADERLIGWLGLIGLLAFTLMVGISMVLSRDLRRDIRTVTDGITRLAGGNREPIGQAFGNSREMQRIGDALEVFRTKLAELDRATAEIRQTNRQLEAEIEQRRQAEDGLRLSAQVFDSNLYGILITDGQGIVQQVNAEFTSITGYTAAEAIGKTPSILKSERHDKEFYKDMWNALTSVGRWEGEIWDRRKNGELIPVWQSISSVRDEAGDISHFIASFRDITEQKLSTDRIYHLAHYDQLTGLPNRLLFGERCRHALERARRDNEHVAVLFLDLDRFKHINDSLGHAAGDLLLQEVARLLKEMVREEDTVARLGGDEFVIALEQISGAHDAEHVATKLLDTFKHPLHLRDHELVISASIGISIFPSDGEDVESLIEHADTAMYRAKEQGRGNFQFFTAEFTNRAIERLLLETELRQALERGQLLLHYQPQYHLKTGRLIGAEALLRWRHPEKGLIAPECFIPIAEESGLILPIGEWVLRTACRQAAHWQRSGTQLSSVSVNLSGLQLRRGDIVATVQRVLEETGLAPWCLELEILETYIMQQAAEDIRTLEALRDLGVRLAIDDFGTGQSSLSYLKRLPVGKIKIDRSFVMDIPQDANDIAITKAILALGESLQLTTIAEGVENEAQIAFLRAAGCEQVQGFYYSPPIAPDDFQLLLREVS